MNRRHFILGGLAAAAVSDASATVVQIPNGISRAFIQAPQIVKQQCVEWCWAASASMIFAMHGHPVDQKNIVQRVYGGVVCAPQAGIVIANVVNTPWVDAMGQLFKPDLVAAYDFTAGVNAISNQLIVDEIVANRPLIYGNQHHVMVLSQVDYFNTPAGPNILQIGVFDPWPLNPDFHPLTSLEMTPQHLGGQMALLAAVHI